MVPTQRVWKNVENLGPNGIVFILLLSLCTLSILLSLSGLSWFLPFVLSVQYTHTTNIHAHAPDRIRTRNLSRRAATDPRLLSLLYNTHTPQTSMPTLPTGFEPAISAGERPHTHALNRAATGIGIRSPDSPARSKSLYQDKRFCTE